MIQSVSEASMLLLQLTLFYLYLFSDDSLGVTALLYVVCQGKPLGKVRKQAWQFIYFYFFTFQLYLCHLLL